MDRLAKIGPRGKIGPRPSTHAIAEAPPFRKAAVLGATGCIGRELVTELLARGVITRVVSRSIASLRRNYAEGAVEFFPADLTDHASMLAAAEGCDMLFLCAGVPLEQFDHHVIMGRNLAQALTITRARAMLVSSYWSYGVIREVPITEDFPRRTGTRFAKIRQIQEDLVTNAGGCVAVLPEVFGPGAANSLINDGIASLAKGHTVHWPADPTILRDFLFVPDLRPVLVNLAMRKEAYGRRWNLAGSGAIKPRQLLEMAADRLGESPRVRATPLWFTKVAAKLSSKARETVALYPIYSRPAVLDGGALRHLIGDYRVTPYSLAIDRTLRWMTGGVDVEEAA